MLPILDSSSVLYATKHYGVYLLMRTDTHLPEEQRPSYGVFHTAHKVLFASTQSLGHAITACQEMQNYIDEVLARENQPAAYAGKAN